MWRCVNCDEYLAKQLESQGFVLVTALLYLAVISLLAAYGFHASLLQTKLSQQYRDQAIAIQYAESALAVAEVAIQGDQAQGEGQFNAQARYHFERLSQTNCGVVYYQVDATGNYNAANSTLHTVLQVPVAGQELCPGEPPTKQRVAWWEQVMTP